MFARVARRRVCDEAVDDFTPRVTRIAIKALFLGYAVDGTVQTRPTDVDGVCSQRPAFLIRVSARGRIPTSCASSAVRRECTAHLTGLGADLLRRLPDCRARRLESYVLTYCKMTASHGKEALSTCPSLRPSQALPCKRIVLSSSRIQPSSPLQAIGLPASVTVP